MSLPKDVPFTVMDKRASSQSSLIFFASFLSLLTF